MRLEQIFGTLPNSAANPLPTAVLVPEIRCRPASQIVPKLLIYERFSTSRRRSSDAKTDFSLPSGKCAAVEMVRSRQAVTQGFRNSVQPQIGDVARVLL